jgi:hypothetical protein
MSILRSGVAALTLIALAGCADQSPQGALDSAPRGGVDEAQSNAAQDQTASAYLFEQLQQRAEGASRVSFASNISDYLPSQLVSVAGATPRSLVYGVVTGSVTQASVTYAGRIGNGDERASSGEVPLDADDADWRLITATLEVSESWVSAETPPRLVRFVVPIGGNVDSQATIAGLRSLERAIVVLTTADDIDPSSWRIAFSDTALGFVDDSGRLLFPAMTEDESRIFLGDVHTLADLGEAASDSQDVITVDKAGNVVES